ncbi:sensor domain-containing diguanylate cyclase [Pseudoxanthomonas indica]|uniref:sensor domain-containing diguanylate cyclase n=1 Tax=Pseudoxanthomonas indica TaxID=428993 RepID=UPI001116B97A|nr:diguanylate cyclase [Pseudoxanthomonas indica]GGD40740.1 hypothetical protein GCM10007235_10990 [Pseudoxanthomonas indica]
MAQEGFQRQQGWDRIGTGRAAWLLLGLLACWLLVAPAQAQEELQLRPGTSIQSLAPHIAYAHDVDGRASVDAMRAQAAQGRFQPLPPAGASFGFQPGAYWFHAQLRNDNPHEPRWLLVQQYALSDRLDVYLRYPDGRVIHHAGGDHVPFDQRSVRYRHPNFQLDLPVGQSVDLFVRVESQSSMQVPLALYTPTSFTELSRDAQFAMGLYFGILLALFTYNLVLWLTLRDASYFWYLFHIGAFGLVLFTLYGLGFEYLWPRSSWLADRSVPLSICLAQIGMQQFARNFLGLRQRWPAGDRVGLGMIALFVLLAIASTQMAIRLSTQLAVVAVIFSVAWIAVEAIVAVRRGYKPARLFLLAWSMFLAGIAMVAMVAFGVLPKNFVTEYSVQIGSALEMLLLSVALGYRYASLRNQNERIVRESRDQLELKVAQRTGELRQALEQLETAHLRLREFSRLDGLTELYNRAHFREAFEHLMSQARNSRRPISLLMIDLDHFKRINDTYGHLVGDDCLRWTSNTMAETLRPHGALVARFGGEEFIAALPDMGLAEASLVAEELRQRLRERPCRSGDLDIAISASIGVHCVDTHAKDSLDSALQVADQALYTAKAEGRDCVRTL